MSWWFFLSHRGWMILPLQRDATTTKQHLATGVGAHGSNPDLGWSDIKFFGASGGFRVTYWWLYRRYLTGAASNTAAVWKTLMSSGIPLPSCWGLASFMGNPKINHGLHGIPEGQRGLNARMDHQTTTWDLCALIFFGKEWLSFLWNPHFMFAA